MATKKSAWTEADYAAAGKVKVQLRLDRTVAQILIDEADRLGISRQALIERLLSGYKAAGEMPLLNPEDYGTSKPKRKKGK